MPIVRKSVRVTNLEPAPIDPSRIRCQGLTFSPGVCVWIDAATSPGKKLKALPKVRVGVPFHDPKADRSGVDAPARPLIQSPEEDFTSTPFPDGILWKKLPPLAVEAFASMLAMADWGYDGYCELLAGIQMASEARLHFIRKRGNKTLIRLRIGKERFELLISAFDLVPFLLEEPVAAMGAARPLSAPGRDDAR